MTEAKTIKTKANQEKKEAKLEFKGKYIKAVGRRKTAVAQVRLYEKGEGQVVVNDMPVVKYFSESEAAIAQQPIKLAGLKDADFSILVKGGGKSAQSEAIRHGLARVLVLFNEELTPVIKAKGWMTRDSRKVERKKPGLKKARKSPQWSKR